MHLSSAGRRRRGFLKKGLFGTALLLLGGGGFLFTRPTRRTKAPPERLVTFTEDEYAVLDAISRRFAPMREGFPSVDEVQPALWADRLLARASEDVKQELKRLLGLFENGLGNFFFGFRFRPFTQLSPDEQDRVLAEWRDSRLVVRRSGYRALHVLLMTAYYGSPKTWSALGYPGPPPGFHQPDAPVWKGGGEPRPFGNGVFVDSGGQK